MSSSLSALSSLTGSSSSSNGIDVGAVVDQLMQVERAPEQLMQTHQTLLQQQKSALNDLQTKLNSLESAINTLRDPLGAFARIGVQSGDTSVFRASADAGATAGMHTAVVTRLASTSSVHSRVLGTADTITAGSSFDLQVGDGDALTVTFDSDHTTLSAAANYINGLHAGVTAMVVNGANGTQLALTSNSSGAAGQITISNDTTGLQLQQGSQGLNAQVTIDGIPVESTTNTVTDALPGITLDLVSAAPGREVVFQVSRDPSATVSATQNFVNDYNDVIKAINAQFTYNTTSKTSGVLASDPTMRVLQQQLLSMVTQTVDGSGDVTSLAQIGVTMNNDGTLTLDSGKLNSLLASDFNQVQNFFQAEKTGFAVVASSTLDSMTDSTASAIAADLKGIAAESQDITNSIADFEVRMTAREKQLTDEYTRIDVMLREFSATQQQVSSQLASLPKTS